MDLGSGKEIRMQTIYSGSQMLKQKTQNLLAAWRGLEGKKWIHKSHVTRTGSWNTGCPSIKEKQDQSLSKTRQECDKDIKDMLEFPWIMPETVFKALLSFTVRYFGFVKWILSMIHVFLAGLINHSMHLVLERRKFPAVSTEDLLKADLADFLRLTSQELCYS